MTSDRKGLSESVFIDSIKFVTAGYHTNLENKKKEATTIYEKRGRHSGNVNIVLLIKILFKVFKVTKSE